MKKFVFWAATVLAAAAAYAQPANDNFANRIALSGAIVSTTGSNVGAGIEANEILSNGFNRWGMTVWWSWTAPASGAVNINTIGSSFNTALDIYTGTVINGTSVVFNNDIGGGTNTSSVNFTATAGTQYNIQVGGNRGFGGNIANGSIQLRITMAASVSISSPTNGAVIAHGDPIPITATATLPNPVDHVDFYRAGSLIGTVTSSPYTFVYNNAPLGQNSFYVVATDSASLNFTSAVVTVTVANPGVAITSPADSTTYQTLDPISIAATTIGITATNVEFFVDQQKIGEDNLSPFAFTWSSVTPGSHALSAVAWDNNGIAYAAPPIPIAVAYSLVATGSVWKYLDDGTDQGTNWTAWDFNDSTWAAGPAQLGYGDGDERTELCCSNAAIKYITYYFRHTFTATNAASYTNLILRVLRDDGAVVFVNGREAGRFNMPNGVITNMTLANNANDDGTVYYSSIATNYLVEGTNILAVELHQSANNSSDISFDMELLAMPAIIRNQSPIVTLTNPTNNAALVVPASITLTADASDPDGTVASVEFFVDGVSLGKATETNSPYTLAWNAPAIGFHSVRAEAVDNLGASRSVTVSISIHDASATPLVQITSPANATTISGLEGPTNLPIAAVAAGVGGVSSVQFWANGVVITGDAASPYGTVWTNAAFGTNQLTAVVYDGQGGVATSAVVTVTIVEPPINTNAPVIASVVPIQSASVTNLTSIQVIFSERVTGVNASDLLINGVAATGLSGSGSNFTFTFTPPAYGTVSITWAASHGIADIGWPSSLLFDETVPSASWSYTLLDRIPPVVATRTPPAGATVTNLTQISVGFSKAITGVDASDLLINGTPAIGLSGSGSNYTFNFTQPGGGTVNITWSANHGITDLVSPPNAFNPATAGNTWNYTLDLRTVLVQSNALWMFIKGTNEASNPIDAWRMLSFDDSSWTPSLAPFFYGDSGYTNAQNPGTAINDMLGGAYSSIYLRKTFFLPSAVGVTNLFLNAQCDDGFIAWLNGQEIHRYNMAGGDIPYNGSAPNTAPEPNNNGAGWILYDISQFASALRSGTNVLAIHGFNNQPLTSSDFGMNAQLYTYVADPSQVPPVIAGISPAAGSVFALSNITVTFSEPVSGVDAQDLRVNGAGATAVSGGTSNTAYTFSFAQPPYGTVTLNWDAAHGIADFDEPPKGFDASSPGTSWQYNLLNPNAPTVVSQTPVAGAQVSSLTQITVNFSKPVTGVDAADFRINGLPASSVSGSGATYTFNFAQPAYGTVAIAWVTNHGIKDLDAPANDFDIARTGNTWTYTVLDLIPPAIAAKNPPAGSAVTNLTQITVTFTEPVAGVDASDLLINGVPASSVSGSGAAYTFGFTQPNATIINVTWASTHGIHDLAASPNAFNATTAGSTWSYSTPDTLAPSVATFDPPANITLSSLTEVQVTFSEPVVGVDAADLLMNSRPARAVTGSGAGPYVFNFLQPSNGAVEVRWSPTHGITDLASPANALGGGEWNYWLDPNATFAGKVLINEIMFDAASGRPADEWIELRNVSTNQVSLAGWRFSRGVGFTFPNVVIPAGGYLVVAADLAAFNAKYPGITNVVGGWTGSLANSAETIELTTALGEVVNRVHYATEGDWGQRERGNGAKLVTSITRSGTTATVTIFHHGYTSSDQVMISGADQPEYNGRFTLSGIAASTFNITVSGSPATPATGRILCRQILDNGQSGWSWFNAAAGFGNSLELINPNRPNDVGQNWLVSTNLNGTPGRANSVASANLAPFIQEVTHFPPVPASTDPVAITARVSDELSNGVQSVTLFYRDHTSTSPGAFNSTPMYDKGTNNDGVAGDGIYGAILPANANGTVIEFYVQATDSTGLSRTWPAPAWNTNNVYGQFANALYQVDNEAIGNTMPAMRIVLSGTERAIFPPSDRNGDAPMNATLIARDGGGTSVRYGCGVRVRGAGTRTRTPTNNRLDIPRDNPWNGRISLNLNSQFIHASLVGNVLAQKSGLVATDAQVIQYRINGVNPAPITAPQNLSGNGAGWGTFVMLKPVDGDLLGDLFPNDASGDVYRCSSGNHAGEFSYAANLDTYLNRGYYKTSNRTLNDWSDFNNLCITMSQVTDPTLYLQAVSSNVNVKEWMTYFAVCSLFNDGETKLGNGIGDDFALYAGMNDKRFVVLGHDFDTIFGQGDTGPNYYPINTNSSIFIMLNPPNPNGTPANLQTQLSRFFHHPQIAPVFYAELKRLCDTTFNPTNLNPLLDQLLTGWGVGPDAATITAMKNYAANRRAAVLAQIPLALTVSNLPAVSSGYPATTTANLTLFGTAHAIDTRKVLVNGVAANWSAFDARWTNTVTLQPGINRVQVQSLDSNNVAFASSTVDIWYDDASVQSVSGTLSANTTWTAASGPYNVTANLTVPNGITLTIQPGTTVYVASGVTITVNGTGKILAQGTDAQHIRIGKNPAATGNWGSLDFISATVESRLSYVDFDSCGGTTIGGHNAQLHVNNAIAFIDHCTWPSTPVIEYISFDASSFIVQNCTFPSYPPPTGPESLHGVNGIPAGGYGIFRDNYFGHTWGFNDTIDFTGGNRPGPILQIINNVFDGASDDCLDLDSTDAWIEGNLFMHVHRDPTRTDNALDTGSAISGGVDTLGQNSDWTIINNLFYDVDHVFLNKGNSTTTGNGGGRVAFLYNTVIHVAKEYSGSTAAEIAAFDWSDDNIALPDPSIGSGMYAAYNIIYDCPVLQRLYNPTNHTVIFDNNILANPWTGPGSGNQFVDPLLNLGVLAGTAPTNVTVAQLRQAARLLPGSPAIGVGFGGLNLGGYQAHGITISGEPSGPTPFTSATLTVGPAGTFNWGTTAAQRWGWTAFKWNLDGGPWSAEIVVTNNSPFTNLAKIQLVDLSPGPHTVYVVGKNDAGYYQDDTFVYPATAGIPASVTASRTWVVDPAALPLRLNEILASNGGAVNHEGTTPDLVELYNDSDELIELAGVRLTDDPVNPDKFIFPANAIIGPRENLVVYANNPDGTSGYHLGFNLNQQGDRLYLYDDPARGGRLLDSITFGLQLTDLSVGRMADGSWALTTPTFGAPNRPARVGNPAALRINEWLAIGQNPISTDFVELFNGDPLPVSLGGLYMSDTILGWPDRHQFAALSFIAGYGYLELFADADPSQGPDHLNFKLSTEHGAIALYQPDLTPIDIVIYQPQLPNISQGRSPNGSTTIASFDQPTPGAPNPAVGSAPFGGALVINEIMAANASESVIFVSGGVTNTVTPDWLELYNGTTNSVALDDMSVTDDTTQPRRFVFAAGSSLPAGGFLRLYCSSSLPPTNNSTGFGLKSTGGSVFLFNTPAAGAGLVNSITYGFQTENLSVGRVPNGSANWVLTSPTPQAGNAAVPNLGSQSALRINEWMADPDGGDDWFELYNASPLPVAVGGLYLTDTLDNRTKQLVPPLSFIGSGANAWRKIIADGNTGAGADHVIFSLRGLGEAIGLFTAAGVQLDAIGFDAQTNGVSEGRFPDGSANIVRFPGTASPGDSNYRWLTNVVVNEALTHTDLPLEDAIELRNLTAQAIDISGWWLSDDRGTVQKYQIPGGTILPANGYTVIYENQFTNRALAAIPFALSSHGDEIVLAASANNQLTGYRTFVKFGASANSVSFGRYVNSVGDEQFVAMSARTFGQDDPVNVDQFRLGTGLPNAYPLVGPVVISEIMYHPPDIGTNDNVANEYIELFNLSTVPVTLYDPSYPTNVWHLRDAVDFDFPPNTVIQPGAYLLVVSFDPVNNPAALAAFRTNYQITAAVAIVGPYSGKLANSSGSVELRRPDLPDLDEVPYILVDRVKYADTAPWPEAADGLGYSLRRVVLSEFGNDPANWVADVPSPGPAAAPVDIDHDGIPNTWELANGLDPFNPSDGALDSDGDGLSNYQEYLAGTNPFDAQSTLKLDATVTTVTRTNIVLSFTAAADRAYLVEFAGAVTNQTWSVLSDIPIANTNRTILLPVSPTERMRIYRIRTQ